MPGIACCRETILSGSSKPVVWGARGLFPLWVPVVFVISVRVPVNSANPREASVRFGSVTVQGCTGSSGSGFRFRRFLCKKGFSLFQYSLTGKDGSGSGFGSWKTVPAVPVPLTVSGKTVPTVPVPGSSLVPESPANPTLNSFLFVFGC